MGEERTELDASSVPPTDSWLGAGPSSQVIINRASYLVVGVGVGGGFGGGGGGGGVGWGGGEVLGWVLVFWNGTDEGTRKLHRGLGKGNNVE